MNYFEYHGTTIYDDEKLNILKNAAFCADIIKITRFQPYINSQQEQEIDGQEFSNAMCFIYQNQLYRFLTNQRGRIESFFKLATRNEFLIGKAGCYYEFE